MKNKSDILKADGEVCKHYADCSICNRNKKKPQRCTMAIQKYCHFYEKQTCECQHLAINEDIEAYCEDCGKLWKYKKGAGWMEYTKK